MSSSTPSCNGGRPERQLYPASRSRCRVPYSHWENFAIRTSPNTAEEDHRLAVLFDRTPAAIRRQRLRLYAA